MPLGDISNYKIVASRKFADATAGRDINMTLLYWRHVTSHTHAYMYTLHRHATPQIQSH